VENWLISGVKVTSSISLWHF